MSAAWSLRRNAADLVKLAQLIDDGYPLDAADEGVSVVMTSLECWRDMTRKGLHEPVKVMEAVDE